VVQHYHLRDDMTLITFEDGKAVLRDGKVGTEQACCCEEPCACQYGDLPDCDIDYIAFDYSFLFPDCTGNRISGTITLNSGNNFYSGILDVNDAAAACDYQISALLGCVTSWRNDSFTPSQYILRWGITFDVFAHSCCQGVLCPILSSAGITFPLGTSTANGTCCPYPFSGALVGTELANGSQPCPGWDITLSNMTVVLL
jgi:hypothetical protein